MTAPVLRVIGHLPPTTSPTVTNLRGSVLILEAAVADTLPVPASVYVDDHAVQLTLDTEDALNAWAVWLSVEVTPFEIGGGVILYYSAKTTVFEVPVVISWSEVGDLA